MNNDKFFITYCPKCGEQGWTEKGMDKCSFCGTKELPTKYDWDEWLFGNSYPENLDKIIFDEYIKDNPLFDEDLYLSRVNKEKLMAQVTLDKQQQANKPKCPTCGSTDVQPISVTKKVTGFVLVGIFSSNFGKSYECKSCGYKW